MLPTSTPPQSPALKISPKTFQKLTVFKAHAFGCAGQKKKPDRFGASIFFRTLLQEEQKLIQKPSKAFFEETPPAKHHRQCRAQAFLVHLLFNVFRPNWKVLYIDSFCKSSSSEFHVIFGSIPPRNYIT